MSDFVCKSFNYFGLGLPGKYTGLKCTPKKEWKKMSSSEKKKIINEISVFIKKNKKTVSDALSTIFKKSRFVLVGEAHLEEYTSVRRSVARALKRLKREGVTHVAFEVKRHLKKRINALNFSSLNIKEELRKISPLVFNDGICEMLIEAKKIGLETLLIDYNDGRPASMRENAKWQNFRDQKMCETIKSSVPHSGKVLIYIGGAHVHKRATESYPGGLVTRLGARLARLYGNNSVAAIRPLRRDAHFDNLFSFMSKTPKVRDVLPGSGGVFILPDRGPVKGDQRTTASDYILVNNSKTLHDFH